MDQHILNIGSDKVLKLSIVHYHCCKIAEGYLDDSRPIYIDFYIPNNKTDDLYNYWGTNCRSENIK